MASIRARADSGKLFFDFRFQGVRCREQTLLDDTPANRRRLEKVLQRIELEIHQGVFDYSAFFPGSKLAATASAEMQGQPIEFVISGKVDGDSMSGTLTAPIVPDPLSFTGSRV